MLIAVIPALSSSKCAIQIELQNEKVYFIDIDWVVASGCQSEDANVSILYARAYVCRFTSKESRGGIVRPRVRFGWDGAMVA